MRGFQNKNFIILLIFFIIVVAFFKIPQLSSGIKTGSLVANLLIPVESKWKPLNIFTEEPVKEEYIIQSSSGRGLTIHLYHLPEDFKNKTAIIIYTPFLGGALKDPRLVNLANSFARVGFVVVIPWRETDPLVVSTKDTEDMVSTALFIRDNKDLEISDLGFLGLSYGNGPTIIAANDSRIKNDVDFIISLAGYYDLANEFEFIQTGKYSYQSISGQTEPHGYAKDILNATMDYYQISIEELNGEFLEKLKIELSPATVVKELQVDFFITHSTEDPFVPYTESLRLRDALEGRDNVYFSLNTIFSHGDYKEFNFENFRKFYLPSFSSFYKLLYSLIFKYS